MRASPFPNPVTHSADPGGEPAKMLTCSQPSPEEEGRSLVRGLCPELRWASLTDTVELSSWAALRRQTSPL